MKISLEKNLCAIDNYKQIMRLERDLIQVEDVMVKGCDLIVVYLDGYRMVVQGKILSIQLGDSKHDIQNNNAKK